MQPRGQAERRAVKMHVGEQGIRTTKAELQFIRRYGVTHIDAAVDAGVPAHVLSAALYDRFASRAEGDFANRVLSAMRHAFGGHLEKKPGE